MRIVPIHAVAWILRYIKIVLSIVAFVVALPHGFRLSSNPAASSKFMMAQTLFGTQNTAI
jgi:hypothetical protein